MTDDVIRLMLIEDNEDDRIAFARVMKKSGMTVSVFECENADRALEALRRDAGGADLVIADYDLPGMNGLEFCQTVLREKIAVPLIMLTGKGSEFIAVEALKSGVDDYIIKDAEGFYLKLLPFVVKSALNRFADRAVRRRAEDLIRKSEENYRTIFNAINDMIVVHDADTGNPVEVNDKTLNMLGYAQDEFLALQVEDWSQGVPPYSRKEAMARLRAAASGAPQMFEWRCRKKNGDLFWTEVNLRRARIHDNDAVIAVVRDIDDRKKAEEEKAVMEARLRQTCKMEALGTLAGGVAHDFNNILAIIMGATELAMDEIPKWSPAARYMNEILQASARAKNMVRRIIAFTRMSMSRVSDVDPAPIAAEVLKLLRASIPTTIEIQSDIDQDCGLIRADPSELHQALMNICANAAQAIGDGGGLIRVSLTAVTLTEKDLAAEPDLKPGAYAAISVADSGCGIVRDNIHRLFDPYFTTKEVDQGSGMGLAAAHGIVKNHGGFIAVESVPGQGSVFRVCLPLKQTAVEKKAPEAEPAPAGSERILFVDDEEQLAEMGKDLLQRLGYSVTMRTDSRAAFDVFKKNPDGFDLIITDQTMPGMTGLDLARAAMGVRPDIPVILCTGHSAQVNEHTVCERGVRAYALKPISKKEIAVLIRKVLDKA